MAEEGGGQDRVRCDLRDGVADVRLCRPDKLNALDGAMIAALEGVLDRLGRAPALRAVVLSGEGRGFSAGLDLESVASLAGGTGAEALAPGGLARRTHGAANRFQHLALGWRALPVPVIAAVHGPCFGGALQVALGADLRFVCADARLSLMEIRWGIVPDMGATVLLRRLVRGDVARELALTGRIVPGEEAVALGLATPRGSDPRESALSTAREIASRSPDAVRAAKRLLDRADDGEGVASLLLAESEEQDRLIGSPNQREAVAAGLARRAPRFADPAA